MRKVLILALFKIKYHKHIFSFIATSVGSFQK